MQIVILKKRTVTIFIHTLSKQRPPLLTVVLSFNLQKEILLHKPGMNPLADSLGKRVVRHVRGNHHTFIGRQAFIKQHVP